MKSHIGSLESYWACSKRKCRRFWCTGLKAFRGESPHVRQTWDHHKEHSARCQPQQGHSFRKAQDDWAEFAAMKKATSLKDWIQGQDLHADTVGRRSTEYEPILRQSSVWRFKGQASYFILTTSSLPWKLRQYCYDQNSGKFAISWDKFCDKCYYFLNIVFPLKLQPSKYKSEKKILS